MDNLFNWANDYLKVVDSFWNEGNYEDGVKVLESILFEEPGFAKAHGYIGWYAHYHQRNRKKAKMHYELALKFDPKWGNTYSNYSEFLVEDANEERMRALLNEGLKHGDIDKSELHNNLGRILEIKEKYAEASEQYKNALKYTMNFYTLTNIKGNRKRARVKYHLFGSWYSFLL